MGTNYYLESEACKSCGRGSEKLHIGKSSAGWCFSLHVDPSLNINGLDDWRALWARKDARIVNEYGAAVPPHEIEEIICGRSSSSADRLSPEYLAMNHAVAGPNGLLRHEIGRFCIGHGDGTFDLMVGEFS